jgi:hypothetical protein
MAYIEARVLSRDNLHTLKDGGYLKLQEPVTTELLGRMREAAAKTQNLKPVFKSILQRQGLIP